MTILTLVKLEKLANKSEYLFVYYTIVPK